MSCNEDSRRRIDPFSESISLHGISIVHDSRGRRNTDMMTGGGRDRRGQSVSDGSTAIHVPEAQRMRVVEKETDTLKMGLIRPKKGHDGHGKNGHRAICMMTWRDQSPIAGVCRLSGVTQTITESLQEAYQ
jgi:hypothetical protein